MLTLAQRFEAFVVRPPGELCHVWLGRLNKKGYGCFDLGGDAKLAHRVAWFLVMGSWPAKLLRHTCDHPCCVRFDHLIEGNNLQNARDVKLRGKSLKEFGRWNTKLSNAQVTQIHLTGRSRPQAETAAEFGVSVSHISEILSGKKRT